MGEKIAKRKPLEKHRRKLQNSALQRYSELSPSAQECALHEIMRLRSEKGWVEALGYSKGGFSTKIHLRCEGNGLPVTFLLTVGQRNESVVGRELSCHAHHCFHSALALGFKTPPSLVLLKETSLSRQELRKILLQAHQAMKHMG